MLINVIIDDSIGVTIERASPSARFAQKSGLLNRRRKSLAGLDKVGTALVVESAGSGGIGVDGVNGEYIANVLFQLNECLGADAVGTVNVKRRERLIALF